MENRSDDTPANSKKMSLKSIDPTALVLLAVLLVISVLFVVYLYGSQAGGFLD